MKFLKIFFIFFLLFFQNALTLENEDGDINMTEESLPLQSIENAPDFKIQNEEEIRSKIINLSIDTDLDTLKNDTLYIGQYISIRYAVLLFNDAKIVYTEFNSPIPTIESPKEYKIKSKDAPIYFVNSSPWIKNGDHYISTFTFKIGSKNFSIPSISIHAQNLFTQDVAKTEEIILNAEDLSTYKDFSGVIAKELEIKNFNLESYDENFNAAALSLESKLGNLEDLNIHGIKEQEFEQKSIFNYENSNAILLLKVPKNFKNIEINYYNTSLNQFKTISVPNIINSFTEDEERNDLTPKSSFISLINIILIILIISFSIFAAWKKSILNTAFSVFFLVLLAYNVFSTTYNITTFPNAKVTIQPTHTSTVLLTIPEEVNLEAFDKRSGYYKVNINSKIGWINENDTR